MRILAATCLLLLAVACGGGVPSGPTPTQSATEAETPAVVLAEGVEWQACRILGGGPAPGLNLEGRCASWMEDDVLTEVEAWRCEDFSADAQGFPMCSGEFGTYTIVTRDAGGEDEIIRQFGQFPPWLAQ